MKKYQNIYWKILRPLVIVFLYIKFGYTFKTAKDLPEKFILLSNHNTDFDPLFVGVSFRNGLRYVASEHISRWKFAFNFVNHIFSPILRPKGTNAASTVKEILRASRSGDNVCMFAEGARSWNGITAPISPATGKLVKSTRCALVTYKIKGGYFTSPLWSEGGTRKGKIHGEVVNIYSDEEVASMSVDEINAILNRDLYEDAYDTQTQNRSKYRGRKLAVKMESMLYYCPNCGAIDTLYSKKNNVLCNKCKHSFTYDKYGDVYGIKQKNVKELFAFLRDKTLIDAENKLEYKADCAEIISVKNHVESVISSGELKINDATLNCGEVTIPICDIDDMAMHGRYALVFSTKDTYYEILLKEETNTLKFFMLFQAYKNGRIDKFNF